MSKPLDFPAGALVMLVLRVLQNSSLHGYAIAQRIRTLSSDVLQIEEGSLYPALQRMLLKGWVKAEWGVSETGRKVRVYRITDAGRQQLQDEIQQHGLATEAIQAVLRMA